MTSAWEQHGQTMVAAIILALLVWNASTTYNTKLEVTAMRANLDATLEAQRGQIAELTGQVTASRAIVQQHEVRITVIERAQAERVARESMRISQ